MRLAGLLLAVVGFGTMAAQADPITGKAARTLLFAPEGAEVEVLPQAGLTEKDAALLRTVGATQPYYGAIAVSPDEDLMVDATVAAANYHDTEAALVAALAQCETKRKGAAPCVVVALIRPKGWEPRGVQLSAAATLGFATDYKGKRGKALAISASTGGWGIATGDGAAAEAVAACAAKATPSASDCAVVVAD